MYSGISGRYCTVFTELTCSFSRLSGHKVYGEMHEVWKLLLGPFAVNMTQIHCCPATRGMRKTPSMVLQ